MAVLAIRRSHGVSGSGAITDSVPTLNGVPGISCSRTPHANISLEVRHLRADFGCSSIRKNQSHLQPAEGLSRACAGSASGRRGSHWRWLASATWLRRVSASGAANSGCAWRSAPRHAMLDASCWWRARGAWLVGVGVGVGVVTGLAVALIAAQALRELLYGVQPLDPLSLVASVVWNVVVSAAAPTMPLRPSRGVDLHPWVSCLVRSKPGKSSCKTGASLRGPTSMSSRLRRVGQFTWKRTNWPSWKPASPKPIAAR